MSNGGAVFLPSIDTPEGIAFYQQGQQQQRQKSLWQEKFQEDDDHRRRLLASSSEDKLLVWPSVALYSPYDVAPVGLVHAGETYSIVIEGFDPTMDEVVIELVEGLRERGEVIATTTKATTLTWTAPPMSADDGSASPSRFFLYAHYKRLPGLFDFSSPFRWVDT